jgi:hypothetical protein
METGEQRLDGASGRQRARTKAELAPVELSVPLLLASGSRQRSHRPEGDRALGAARREEARL